MANYVDEFYIVKNGKVKAIYMTYAEFWKKRNTTNNLFESYDTARKYARS